MSASAQYARGSGGDRGGKDPAGSDEEVGEPLIGTGWVEGVFLAEVDNGATASRADAQPNKAADNMSTIGTTLRRGQTIRAAKRAMALRGSERDAITPN